jgi:hypothetical protein
MNKLCYNCRFSKHPNWAVMLPSFIVCEHPDGIEIGRIDVLRASSKYCGPRPKWFEPKHSNATKMRSPKNKPVNHAG